MTLFSNTKFELHFGLFGPELSYHASRYKEDNARLVISLILFKLYFTLPWNSNKLFTFEPYATYGFYSDGDPDRIVFIWGHKYKVWLMPWAKVLVGRSMCRANGDVEYNVGIATVEECKAAAEHNPELYLSTAKYTSDPSNEFTYYTTLIKLRPVIFKYLNWNWLTSEKYEVYTSLKKSVSGYNKFMFSTDSDICLEHQIDLQIMMRDKNYTDF
jgi:hypothetical protein